MSTVKKSRLLVAISSLAIFSLMIATPAQADASDGFDDAANAAEAEALSAPAEDFLDFGDTLSVETQGITSRSTGYKGIACTGQLDTTHYSKGAGGAIYKVKVKCTGTGLDRVNVRVRSILSFTPHAQGSPKKRAQADQIRTVTVGSPSPMVYYVPMSGNAGLGNGYWVKTTTMQITSPGHGTVGSKTVSEKKNIVRR
ncbi:hypothetical protein [Brachybacterium alimentarium]|uniref:hypothetical protein n=1 Tax=Brachybacterium alimentarium TaxID=47845 RepID=UPI0011C08382|nr:hypothetical protein [Brachybacterium alimentarium]